MKIKLLLAALLAWPYFIFSQNSIYVSPDGTGVGTPQDPASLNEALVLAIDNDQEDMIYLQEGIYENTSLTLDYNDPSADLESIHLSGGWNEDFSTDTPDPMLTILYGGTGRILTILAEEVTEDRIFGLYNMSLIDASVTELHGAALAVLGSNEATGTINLEIEFVGFLDNTASTTGYGGAIYTPGGLTITECYFDGNSA